MNEHPRIFRLGIIGGCMSHQDGMPLSKLYHRRFGKGLMEQSGVRLNVRIVREFQRPYHERLDALLAEEQLDGVLLHMRVTIARKSSILSRHSSDGVARYYLHPFLLNRRKVGWAAIELNNFDGGICVVSRKASYVYAAEHNLPRTGTSGKKGGFRFNDLNVILGHMVGLDNWAIRDEMAMLRQFAQACERHQLPFMVLGPSPSNGISQINRLSEKLNTTLAAYLSEIGVPFCPINRAVDEQNRPNLLADGQHLSEAGHEYVANQLLPLATTWVEQILAAKQPFQEQVGA